MIYLRGGGSVYTNVLDKYEKILINDIISDLIGIHKGIIYDCDFVNNVKFLCPKKDDSLGYAKLRNSYNENKSPEKLYALMLSCTNNMVRWNNSGGMNQTFGKRSWNNSTEKKVIEFFNHVNKYKDKIIFVSKDFSEINITKPSMVYIDPPYSSVEDQYGNITSKSMSEAGYNTTYTPKTDIILYDYCKNLDRNKSSFMISGLLEHNGKKSWLLNKLIRDGFNYKELIFDYNKVSKKGKKESKEVIIMNY